MKKVLAVILISVMVVTLGGCNLIKNELGRMTSKLKGKQTIIQTYDEDSNIIDRVEGKSIDISADAKFSIKNSEGETIDKSGVLNITIGGRQMIHVGSSLIAYQEGLTDVFNEYAKNNDITNNDRSVPFINRMVKDVKNLTSGQKLLILVRSQTGKPLATFVGNDVSYFATDIDKSTGFLIDGKYLFIYRCDYTVYDMDLLQ
jgi:hypothetical protein